MKDTDFDVWFNRIVGFISLLFLLVPLVLPYITSITPVWGFYISIFLLATINIILLFKYKQVSDVSRIITERDSKSPGKKDCDFLERIYHFRPKSRLIFIGFTVEYIPVHLKKQLEKILTSYSTVIVYVCILDPHSPCAQLRSIELSEAENTFQEKILHSISSWKSLQDKYPDRIVLKVSEAIPYAEYEAVDIEGKGYIYFVPISYKRHANTTPSFILSSKSKLYNFHKSTIEQILRDSKAV